MRTFAAGAVAAVGLAMTGGAAFADAPVVPFSVSASWGSVFLAGDYDADGKPDVGEVAVAVLTVSVEGGAAHIEGIDCTVSDLDLSLDVTSGITSSTVPVPITAANLSAFGTGPTVGTCNLNYTNSDTGVSGSQAIGALPTLYTAPYPLTVSSSVHVVELNGPTDGKARAGDEVYYTTTVTNNSEFTLDVILPAEYQTGGSRAQSLAPGSSQDFDTVHHLVTVADMEAHSYWLDPATFVWDAPAVWETGSIYQAYDAVATERVDLTFAHSASLWLKGADGLSKASTSAVAGDVAHYRLSLSNLGNVTVDFIKIDATCNGRNTSFTVADSDLQPGQALPQGSWTDGMLDTGLSGPLTGITVTNADITAGFMTCDFTVQGYPTGLKHTAPLYIHSTQKIALRTFTFAVNPTFTGTLNDSNGDGIGQQGETVHYVLSVQNNSTQDITVSDAHGDAGTVIDPSHLPADATQIAQGAAITYDWTETITAAQEAALTLNPCVTATFRGTSDPANARWNACAGPISTGQAASPFVGSAEVTHVADSNGDGAPSIGEVVHLEFTVTNLSAVTLHNVRAGGAGANAADVPWHSVIDSLAPGATVTVSIDAPVTQADFAAGTFSRLIALSADGFSGTSTLGSVSLSGVTFRAAASDLDAAPQGGIAVCVGGKQVTGMPLGTSFTVKPGSCAYQGSPAGYRVVLFSSPVQLAQGSFDATLPAGTSVGKHRLALYAPDGSLVGWQWVTVGGQTLAYTGADARAVRGALAGATLLVLLGTAAVVESGRRRRR